MKLMKFIRNVLVVLGVVLLAGGGYLAFKLGPIVTEFDPAAVEIYTDFATKLLETRDPGQAMMWAVPVEDDSITPEKDSLKSLAASRNFLFVGEALFSEGGTGDHWQALSSHRFHVFL